MPENRPWAKLLGGFLWPGLNMTEIAPKKACALLLARIQPEVFERLLIAWRQQPDLPVTAQCNGRSHPLHGIYPVSLANLLETQLRDDNRRVMVFAETAGAKTLDCPDAAEAFKNRNRPEDLMS